MRCAPGHEGMYMHALTAGLRVAWANLERCDRSGLQDTADVSQREAVAVPKHVRKAPYCAI
jgi:hypothetical protein